MMTCDESVLSEHSLEENLYEIQKKKREERGPQQIYVITLTLTRIYHELVLMQL